MLKTQENMCWQKCTTEHEGDSCVEDFYEKEVDRPVKLEQA